MAVFTGMLLVYQTRMIRVTQRYYRIGMAIAIGFMLLMAVNMLFAAFGGGDGLGVRSDGLGIIVGIVGVLLGAFLLSLDFKQIEDGIQYGLRGASRGWPPSVSPCRWCGSTWRCCG